MAVGSGGFYCEGDTVGIGDNVMFRPQFPFTRCIRARFRPQKRLEPKPNLPQHESERSLSCLSSGDGMRYVIAAGRL